MAFISAIVAAVAGWIGATSTIALLLVRVAVTALISYAIHKITAKDQSATGTSIDPGARQMISPSTSHKIPVIYGKAFIAGAITDAQLVDSNKTMWLCLTISECSGRLFSSGAASTYALNSIFRNTDRLTLLADGITVSHSQDSDGNQDSSMSGLIKIYLYAGSGAAANQITPDTAACVSAPTITPVNAWSVFPDWTAPAGAVLNDSMTNLVFALIRVDYNRDKSVTSVGDFQFGITNSMNLSGDVIWDYATNTIYGAGIRIREMNTSESADSIISRLGYTAFSPVIIT